MRCRSALKLALAFILAGAVGCAGGGTSYPARNGGVVLPDAEPTSSAPDVSAAGSANAMRLAMAIAAREETYRALTPPECQCLAVDASTLGNLLSSERGTIKSFSSFLRPREAHRSSVERRMLYYASQEARNDSAGDALRLYWGLVEAEHSRPLLVESQSIAEKMLADLEELQRRGLAVPMNAPALRSQILKLHDRGLELDLTIKRLNEQLKPMLDLDTSDPNWRIWPQVELQLVVEKIDVDAAIAEGISLRPELRLLRMLSANLDRDTLPAARRALGSINGALGATTVAGCGCLGCLKQLLAQCCDCELPVREEQIDQYREDQEAVVTSEIRLAAFAVETGAVRVAVAEDARKVRAAHLASLEAKLPTGGASSFERNQARLDLLDARQEVIARLADWERARVELREAQGRLVDECRGSH